ncbi:MAG TPA: hypothetical protein PK530_11455 [Anaerolineales bacterium]|nr:hypothetical protein [Anaerolineales bacterium]
MNTYLLSKYLHELTAIWFIAGINGRQLVRYLARPSDDILTEATGRFEKWMVITLLDDPGVKWVHRGEFVGLLVIVALMVFKPF